MITKEIVLLNESGLHARPASMFVKEASKYKCDIKVIKDGKEYNPKSIMSILSMGAGKGDSIIIQAEGENEENVVNELANFIQNKIKD
ncbi:HPr family phosphocarrier protein [Tissierella pigra]|uniref:Phosphocarrier protein HPr n=1 Tax=Tissierella pigra TaxID=2607614 RepID=A0A6N7XFU7_9FIRM|nr:HPr family phosphocarrier protein [Tissierella pigra]MBU5425533.1 HPr family phosphocarrier protein [Tissierella pigra]MSU00911.1 HPr family phosphocarrier protein [Tissierella pigra]